MEGQDKAKHGRKEVLHLHPHSECDPGHRAAGKGARWLVMLAYPKINLFSRRPINVTPIKNVERGERGGIVEEQIKKSHSGKNNEPDPEGFDCCGLISPEQS